MPANIDSGQTVNRCSEVYTFTDIGNTAHGLICRLIAGVCCPPFSQRKRQSSTGNRRKLFILINHSDNRIRIYRTEHPVDYDRTYGKFAFIWFTACFAVYQICQKITIPVCKRNL